MRKLTINGKSIPIWMEKQEDVDKALSMYEELSMTGYVPAKTNMEIRAALLEGLTPLISCPIEEMSVFLKEGQPVLFCIEKFYNKAGTVNPMKYTLARMRDVYAGMVAYGEAPSTSAKERTVWGIPHWHASNFHEFGYS
jgi:hypothetical protein